MSVTYRWYLLGRVFPLFRAGEPVTDVAVPPGTKYEFVGWTKDKGSRDRQVAALDRAGRQGIWVYSSSRRQAVVDARECWGVSVRGYDKSGRCIR